MADLEKAGGQDLPPVDARGEITLPLGGHEYHLRPSRIAISAIEKQLRPLPALVAEGARGDLSLVDQAVIAAELMKAWGLANAGDPMAEQHKGAKPERLADLIYESGGTRILARLLAVMIGALNGGYTAAGEMRPPEKKA
jgi:hypothetical protein